MPNKHWLFLVFSRPATVQPKRIGEESAWPLVRGYSPVAELILHHGIHGNVSARSRRVLEPPGPGARAAAALLLSARPAATVREARRTGEAGLGVDS